MHKDTCHRIPLCFRVPQLHLEYVCTYKPTNAKRLDNRELAVPPDDKLSALQHLSFDRNGLSSSWIDLDIPKCNLSFYRGFPLSPSPFFRLASTSSVDLRHLGSGPHGYSYFPRSSGVPEFHYSPPCYWLLLTNFGRSAMKPVKIVNLSFSVVIVLQ